MTEKLRNWHRRVNQEWSDADLHKRMDLVVSFPHGLAASFIDAQLAAPKAQTVDVDVIRAVIDTLRSKRNTGLRDIADILAAALPKEPT
jgi:deoxyribose-phosphate aldolase